MIRIIAYFAIATVLMLAGNTQAEVRNYGGDCPAEIVTWATRSNALADKAIAEGKRVGKITAVSCMQTGLWKVHLRAYDGRVMEWKPSDGTDELTRKLLLGR